MGLEASTEQGIKTAFKVVTDALVPALTPYYRCFFLDDREGEEITEERNYPFIRIIAQPNWPTHHGSTFRHVPVELTWATIRKNDPVGENLRNLYEITRTVIDTASNVTITGYNVIGIIIEQGGQVDIQENEQTITLPITVKVCGA